MTYRIDYSLKASAENQFFLYCATSLQSITVFLRIKKKKQGFFGLTLE